MATLLLSGVAINSTLSALMSFIMMMNKQSMDQIMFWIMGTLNGKGWNQIAAVLPHTFFIGCGKDLLKVNEVQAEGKKRMTSDAFLRGSRLEKGMELGK